MKASKEPRRPNLATIVGSGLAVVAAGSLLAFSSLAEQAGLQGLATGGLQPAQPQGGGTARPITVPAPATAPPADPRESLTRRVRDAIARVDAEPQTARVTFEPAPPPAEPKAKREPKAKPKRPDPIEGTARIAVNEPEDAEPPASDGPPYGHAYGHDKNKSKDKDKSKPKKKDEPKASDEPVYARKAKDEPKAKPAKQPKLKKVEKAPKDNGNGKGKSHEKHSNGKGKGHEKNSHSNGKGKGHSKHGH